MDGIKNYAEYTVTQRAEGRNLRKRLALVGLYLAILAACIPLFTITQGAAAVLGGVLFTLFVALVWFTRRLVKEDVKYEVVNAHFKVTVMNESGRSKVVYNSLVSEFSLIAPMNDEYKEHYSSVAQCIDLRGSRKSPDSYFAIKDSTAVCFEATNKMLEVMSFYNKKAIKLSQMRY